MQQQDNHEYPFLYQRQSFLQVQPTPASTLFPYTTLFRSNADEIIVLRDGLIAERGTHQMLLLRDGLYAQMWNRQLEASEDRKSTRLNSSHVSISYAVFCLKKKKATYQKRQKYNPATYLKQ